MVWERGDERQKCQKWRRKGEREKTMMKKNTKETDEATKRDLAEGKKKCEKEWKPFNFFPFFVGSKMGQALNK